MMKDYMSPSPTNGTFMDSKKSKRFDPWFNLIRNKDDKMVHIKYIKNVQYMLTNTAEFIPCTITGYLMFPL